MRITLPHTLGKDEVRRRLQARTGEAAGKASEMLGSLASVESRWLDDDHLAMDVSAMGFTIPCAVALEPAQLVFEVTMPQGLGFARGMSESMIREKGEKLLA